MNRILVVFLVVAGFVIALRTLTGCLTDQMAKDVAGATYAAQQQACIDQYADRASIDRCRNRVKKAWSTDAGTDAGTDAEAGK